MSPPMNHHRQNNKAPEESKHQHGSRPRRGSLPELKSSSDGKKAPTGPKGNPLYKTRLCTNFQSTGSCPYTDKCQFAHGVEELEKWENWRANKKQPEAASNQNNNSNGDSRSHHSREVVEKEEEDRRSIIEDAEDKKSVDTTSPLMKPELVRKRSHSEDGKATASAWNTPLRKSHNYREGMHQEKTSLDELEDRFLQPWEQADELESMTTPSSLRPEESLKSCDKGFSLWSLHEQDSSSTIVDPLSSVSPDQLPLQSQPVREESRNRSSTYDNIAQLQNAPTLFAVPPFFSFLED